MLDRILAVLNQEILFKEKRWKKLYISEDHGLSLNRLQTSLFNYKAPTIMLIYLQSGNVTK